MSDGILLLPGSSGWKGSKAYQDMFTEWENEARRCGFSPHLVSYPGQDPCAPEERLTLEGAIRVTRSACDETRPTWMIARSFGCQVALGAVASGGPWLSSLRGVTLWGPCLLSTYQRMWPTLESQLASAEGYRRYGTFIEPEFYAGTALETLVRDAACHIRIVRGSSDEYSISEDLAFLASIHRRFQFRWSCTTVELNGLTHKAHASEMTDPVAKAYFDALFP